MFNSDVISHVCVTVNSHVCVTVAVSYLIIKKSTIIRTLLSAHFLHQSTTTDAFLNKCRSNHDSSNALRSQKLRDLLL